MLSKILAAVRVILEPQVQLGRLNGVQRRLPELTSSFFPFVSNVVSIVQELTTRHRKPIAPSPTP